MLISLPEHLPLNDLAVEYLTFKKKIVLIR